MLSESSAFVDLSEPSLHQTIVQKFMAGRIPIKKSKNQIIITQTDQTDDVFYISSGLVEVCIVAPNSREYLYREIGPGNIIGELAAIDKQTRSVSVTAKKNTTIYKMDASTFRQLLKDDAEFSDWMIKSLVRRVRDLSEKTYELSIMNVRCRIIQDLIRRGLAAGIQNNTSSFSISAPQSKLASNLGTHREAVNREYTALVDEGYILKEGRRIKIVSITRLESLLSRMMGI